MGQSSRPPRLVSSRLSLNRPACRETNLLAVALASAVRGGDWDWRLVTMGLEAISGGGYPLWLTEVSTDRPTYISQTRPTRSMPCTVDGTANRHAIQAHQ
jgi:hypothetical protein